MKIYLAMGKFTGNLDWHGNSVKEFFRNTKTLITQKASSPIKYFPILSNQLLNKKKRKFSKIR